jgi:hypothetical protein
MFPLQRGGDQLRDWLVKSGDLARKAIGKQNPAISGQGFISHFRLGKKAAWLRLTQIITDAWLAI